MSLLYIVLVLIVVGVILLLINRFIPMDGKIKMILNYAVILVVIIWLLKAMGFFGWLETIKV